MLEWTTSFPLLKRLGERKLLPKKVENVDRILTGRIPTLLLLAKIIKRLLKVEQAVDGAQLNEEEKQQLAEFLELLRKADAKVQSYSATNESLCQQIERLVRESDFKFLFDPQKKLFVIGYNIDNGHKDNSFYDLLASEARLASLVAIAKGDVPQSHWFVMIS